MPLKLSRKSMQLRLFFEAALAVLAAGAIHEGGHWLAAMFFGHRINFRLEWGKLFGKIPVPRGIWNMPNVERRKQRIIAMAVFGAEFLAAPIFYVAAPTTFALAYPVVVLAHFVFYRFYAGEASDFNWF